MLKVLISIFALMLMTAGSVFAGCPDDVYFKPSKSFQLSTPIGYSTLGDVDGDGRKDIIGFTQSSQRETTPVLLVVYKRSATGFDVAPVINQAGASFDTNGDMHVLDTNNDGKMDLIHFGRDPVSNDDYLQTYLGDGTGVFTIGARTFIGYQPTQEFGDLNGDNRPDVATSWNGVVRFRLMQPDGTFGPSTSLGNGTFPYIRDFNNDGRKDILIWYHSAGRRVMYNDGNAVFTPTPVPEVNEAFLAGVADMNSDGRMDFVTSGYPSGANWAVSVYLGQAGGTFTTSELIMPAGSPEFYQVLDINGDSKPDIVGIDNGVTTVALNDGNAQFTFKNYDRGYDMSNFIGNFGATFDDVSGDGRPDLLRINRDRLFKPLSDVIKIDENVCTPFGQTRFIDYDGDGITDMGYFVEATGQWHYRSTRNSMAQVNITGFGTTGDIPVPQDYDGDAYTNRALFRPSNGTWYFMDRAGAITDFQWGKNGDKPVPADFDGDGKADIAIYRPSNGTWWVLNSSDWSYSVYSFGLADDIPVPMDYDGDGKADIAIFRPSAGYWYVQKSTGGYYITAFGINGDKPVPGDYDNDGSADIAIFRPSDGAWYVMRTRDNLWFYGGAWGSVTQTPVPISRPAYGLNIAVYRPGTQVLHEINQPQQNLNGFGSNRIVSTILPN